MSQLAIARSVQDDLLREAQRHRLAVAARSREPGLRERLAARLGRTGPARQEAGRAAAASK